jgi:hypothetical protein
MVPAGTAFCIVDTVLNAATSRTADQEANMYSLDPNINTAMERQAEQVRVVQAYGSRQAPERPTPRWEGQLHQTAGNATLALAAAAPFLVLVVWGLLAG